MDAGTGRRVVEAEVIGRAIGARRVVAADVPGRGTAVLSLFVEGAGMAILDGATAFVGLVLVLLEGTGRGIDVDLGNPTFPTTAALDLGTVFLEGPKISSSRTRSLEARREDKVQIYHLTNLLSGLGT